MDDKELLKRYTSHTLDDDQIDAQTKIRQGVIDLSKLVNKNLVDCREKSLALTKLEEVLFFSNAGIARNRNV